ncbi:SDR family oxidoreductase [Gymnodinialimonas sp. 57CJ19]|uniref:SDR family NAD(P)-dependent oxidoreductase n=1 Tax=Gymnodinialimonas sp. 57CJ19 TaxID=3138498 RepID=UPI003134376E
MNVTGHHAVVTGGGTGIGLSIALGLAGLGMEVSITGRDEERLGTLADMHPRLHALPMDVTDEAAVREGFKGAAERHGPVCVCVANAGIAEPARFRHETLDHWRKTMATNLDGVFLTFQAAMATLERDAWGRMIAISSIAGLRGLSGAVSYTASKHGVIGLMRGLSEEYMGSAMTFNAICPGYVDTPIVERNAAQIAASQGMTEDDARALLARGNRHKRLLATDEVTATALWLVSDAARSVNGQAIQIAGGQVS